MDDNEKVLERVRLMLRKAIRTHRLNAKVTLHGLAQKIGCDRNTIMNYESGRTDPKVVDVAMIAHAIGCKLEDLIPTQDAMIMADRSGLMEFGE